MSINIWWLNGWILSRNYLIIQLLLCWWPCCHYHKFVCAGDSCAFMSEPRSLVKLIEITSEMTTDRVPASLYRCRQILNWMLHPRSLNFSLFWRSEQSSPTLLGWAQRIRWIQQKLYLPMVWLSLQPIILLSLNLINNFVNRKESLRLNSRISTILPLCSCSKMHI